MRVLVTGGSGRAGAFTVRELAMAGHDVVTVDQERPREPLPGSFLKAALTDAGEVYDVMMQVKPEAVCHLAANPAPYGDPRQQVFQNNVMSTYHVMQAAGDIGTVTRFVYASSEMATGWITTRELPPRLPFREEDRVNTPNAYALSKFMGEVIADSLTLRYPLMAFVSLRINNVITPDTYHWLAERRSGYPDAGSSNYWSYIDARDVATAFRASIEGSTIGHEVFLIAAADTCLDIPTREALFTRFGEVAVERLAAGHGAYQSLVNCTKIHEQLGWEAKHSWRDQTLL